MEILWAAEHVLATSGYAAFTIRAVAAVVGITPGNLAYHYKTKRELLRAVISKMIADCAKRIDNFLQLPAYKGRDPFGELAASLIEDSATPVTSRLFRELWAMALHDRFVKEAVERLYESSAKRMVNVLRQSHPQLDASTSKEIVYLLLIICEGTNPIYGTRSPRSAPISKVSRLAVDVLLHLANSRSRSVVQRRAPSK